MKGSVLADNAMGYTASRGLERIFSVRIRHPKPILRAIQLREFRGLRPEHALRPGDAMRWRFHQIEAVSSVFPDPNYL